MTKRNLPEPGSPLKLADGTVINPSTGKRDSAPFVQIPSNTEAQRLVVETRKKVIDLPDVPSRVNVIAAVASYHLFGLDDAEIAIALETSEDQVTRIRGLDTFSKFLDDVISGISEAQADEIRGMLHEGAREAAQRVRGLVNSQNEQVALNAAKDVLDRDGHRPADVIDHRISVDGGLTIRYIDASGDQALEGITIEHEGEQ